jgi:hypothetical protein
LLDEVLLVLLLGVTFVGFAGFFFVRFFLLVSERDSEASSSLSTLSFFLFLVGVGVDFFLVDVGFVFSFLSEEEDGLDLDVDIEIDLELTLLFPSLLVVDFFLFESFIPFPKRLRKN